MRWACALTFCGLVCSAGLAGRSSRLFQTTQTSRQTPPVFRSGVDLVPLDVSVLDRDGKPVRNLSRQDFTIIEDNVPREIKVFSEIALAPEPPPPGAPAVLVRTPPGDRTAAQPTSPTSPQTRRIFLIVLGFGRLQEPTKAYDATIQFIRERLLPQDFVGLIGWNRATDLTTSHEQVAQIVERYKKQSDAITQELSNQALYHPGDDIPASIQADIDAVFQPPGGSSVRMRSAVEMLLGTDEFTRENRGDTAIPWNQYFASGGPKVNNYLAAADRRLDGDLPKIYAGIEYLRHLDGEKHLIVCTMAANTYVVHRQIEAGLAGPSVQNDEQLATRAGDARIALDIIYTAGVPAFKGFPRHLTAASQVSNPEFVDGAASAERVAELTGGQFLGTYPAAATFARIDQATRFGYLLGYSPANPALDDRFRKVTVKVNRPGVSIFFRHGYHPEEDLQVLDLSAAMTAARRAGAARYDRESHDILVTAKALALPSARGGLEIRVDVTIDPSRVTFSPADGRHTAGLDVSIYCGDEKQTVIGQVQDTLALQLSDDELQDTRKNGIRYTGRVPISGVAKYVKVVVYDFGADLTGTAMITVK